MSPSSKRILFVISPIIVVLVIIIGIFAFNNEERLKNNSDLLKVSYRLLEQSDNTYSLVQAIESNSNNYLFTGDEVSLSDYKAGLTQLLVSMDTLKSMTRGMPVLQPGTDSLAGIINRHIVFINSYLDKTKGKTLDSDAQLDYIHLNKYYRDKINAILSELMIEENGQLRQREDDNAKGISNFHRIFLTLRIGTFLLMVTIIVLLVRNNNKS